MSKRLLAPFPAYLYRIYVVFTPSATFGIQYNEVEEHRRLSDIISRSGNMRAFFAPKTLTTHSFCELRAHAQSRRQLEEELTFFEEGDQFFGSVWFYGDGQSEFTRLVAQFALRDKMKMVNYAKRRSVLDRYLVNWYGRFNTLE